MTRVDAVGKVVASIKADEARKSVAAIRVFAAGKTDAVAKRLQQ